MNDNTKFKVMLGLFGVWALGLILTISFGRFPKQLEYFITFLCVGWFAYWTLSTIKAMFRKPNPPVVPTVTQPTPETSTNAKPTKKNK